MTFEACGIPGTWVTMVVDNAGDVGDYNSIALKSDNSPCISYNDHTNASLKYACWTSSPPVLGLACPTEDKAFWASPLDLVNRDLSVDYMITNGGAVDAFNLQIVSSPSTNGVTPASTFPLTVAISLPSGTGSMVTVKHHVPMGVYGFKNSTYATAEDAGGFMFNYPCQSL